MGYLPMSGNEHFHRGYSLRPHKSKSLINHGIISKGLARSTDFLDRLVSAVRQVGLDVYQIDHEDANGQFEVNFTYSEALTTADRYIFFKMAASEIAHQMGMIATFMPKPFANRTGTGAHFHISLGDATVPNLF